MAESAVSMVITKLGPVIKDLVEEEVCLHLNAESEAENLLKNLEKIQKVLAVAEQKGVVDLKVKSWLTKLQDIAYDIEDVLEERNYDLLKQKHEEMEDSLSNSSVHPWQQKVVSFLQSICLCFNRVCEHRRIALSVKGLNGRLGSVADENEKEFKFLPDLSPNDLPDQFKRIESTSQVDESEVHGREVDLENLMEKLVRKGGSSSSAQHQVISIVGAGGMGKTTLAQCAFERVTDRFEKKVWVCVSDPFEEIKIANAILESLNMSSPHVSKLETLLKEIEKAIDKKKFLLVLDDVWLENEERWEPFRNALKKRGAPGSKILVTTRSTTVAETIGSLGPDIIELKQLTDSDCWTILSRLAFRGRSDADRRMLESIGRGIAKKCKGLPLAARIMGSLLRSMNRMEQWENVLESEMWELEKASTDLFPILKLSYNKLPPTHRRCFSYCAMFPKDYEIDVDLLKGLWMAQGFVPGIDADEEEREAQSIFDYLAARSFFQDFERGGVGSGRIFACKIHDIVHDFALFLTENECRVSVEEDEAGKSVCCQNARHILLTSSTPRSIVSVSLAENLRTLIFYRIQPPGDLFNHLKRVRALVLSYCKAVPTEVGNMIHLRYLALRRSNEVKELPESLFNLFELQTLDIETTKIVQMPEGIQNLNKLRHLLIFQYTQLPRGFDKLCDLRTLSTVFVNYSKLGFLKNMNKLTRFILKVMDDVTEASDGEGAYACEAAERPKFLKNKRFLQTLDLHLWGYFSMCLVEDLQPHENLQRLWLESVPEPPSWLASLIHLRILTLFCNETETFGWEYLVTLPALENLSLVNYCVVKNICMEMIEMALQEPTASSSLPILFPQLKALQFCQCSNWEEWVDISEEEENKIQELSIFPSLQSLEIKFCEKLKELPHRLLRKVSSLKCLFIIRCPDLASRYHPNVGEHWEKISHIPYVEI